VLPHQHLSASPVAHDNIALFVDLIPVDATSVLSYLLSVRHLSVHRYQPESKSVKMNENRENS